MNTIWAWLEGPSNLSNGWVLLMMLALLFNGILWLLS